MGTEIYTKKLKNVYDPDDRRSVGNSSFDSLCNFPSKEIK